MQCVFSAYYRTKLEIINHKKFELFTNTKNFDTHF